MTGVEEMAEVGTVISAAELVKKLMAGERDFSNTRIPADKGDLTATDGFEEMNKFLRGLTDLRENPIQANNVDWSGIKARGLHFLGAKMAGANLQGADLRDATIMRADVSGGNFRGANVSGTVFIGARLMEADFTGATMK